MRRLLNLKFLVLLATFMSLLAGSAYLYRKIKREQNERLLYAEALRDEQRGDLTAVAKKLKLYVAFAPRDLKGLTKLANVLRKDAKSPDGRYQAYLVLEQLIKTAPAQDDARRELVKLAMSLDLVGAALPHLEALAKKFPAEGEHEMQIGQCLAAQRKFEEAAAHFEKAIKTSPALIEAYVRYAVMSDARPGKYRSPGEVLDQCVAANPKSAKAYYERGLFFRKSDKNLAARDIEHALELAPDDAEILNEVAQIALGRKDREVARKVSEHGQKLYPSDPRFHMVLAGLQHEAKEYEAARETLRKGVEASKGDRTILWPLANQLLDTGRTDEVSAVIESLRSARAPDVMLRFLDARVLFNRKRWGEAAKNFTTVRTLVPDVPGLAFLGAQSDLYLSRCYARLDNPELRETYARRAVEAEPDSKAARVALAEAFAAGGKLEQASEVYRRILKSVPEFRPAYIRLLIDSNLALPESKRDWKSVGAEVDRLARADPEALETGLLRARLLQAKGDSAAASKLVLRLRDRFPDSTEPWTALAEQLLIEGKSEEVPALLNQAEKKLGERLSLKLVRIAYFQTKEGDSALEGLAGLESKADEFLEEDRTRFLGALASAYQRLGSQKDAARLWSAVARIDSGDVNSRLSLFLDALRRGDDATASRTVSELGSIEGADGTLATFCAACRLIEAAEKGNLQGLPEARGLMERVAKTRPRWPRAAIGLGRIADLAGDRQQAIRQYQAAVDLGDRSPLVVRRLVSLLYESRRYFEGDKLLDSLRSQSVLNDDLAKLAGRLKGRNDSLETLLASAWKAVAQGSKDPSDHLWLGQLLAASGQREEAEAELRRAAIQSSDNPACWNTLVAYLMRAGDKTKAAAVTEEARESLIKAGKLQAVAALYEILGQNDRASQLYQSVLTERPRDAAALRPYAEFALRTNDEKAATSALETLESLGTANPQEAAWATRVLAVRRCAGAADSQIQKILASLDATGATEDDRTESLRTRALILASQPGRPRRQEAIRLLEEVVRRGFATADDELILAGMREEAGDVKGAGETLEHLADLEKNEPRFLSALALFRLRQKNTDAARLAVSTLKRIAPTDASTVEAEARLLAAEGHPAEAVDTVEKAMKFSPPLAPARAAAMLEEFNSEPAMKAAESILRRLAGGKGNPEQKLVLAGFLARRGRIDETLSLCNESWNGCPPEAVGAACEAVANTPGVTDLQREQAASQLENAIKLHPGSATLQARLGAIRETQERFSEAEAAYRKALSLNSHDLISMNNLASLLALRGEKGDESLSLIDGALASAGPLSELLDTRGLVLLARGQTDAAVAEFEQALACRALPVTWFHLARAQSAKGNLPAATTAFKKAMALDFTAEQAHPLERDICSRLAGKVSPSK